MALNLSRNQQLFAAALAQGTGLNPYVIEGWMINEEPQGAQQTVGQNDQNWLNIGNVDSGARIGHGDAIWSNPVAAGRATAQWLKGQNSVAGYGTASPGIRNILSSAGQGPAAQISAIQHSGWATSGEPSLPGLYAQASGGPTPKIPAGYKAPAGSLSATGSGGGGSGSSRGANLGPLQNVGPLKAQLLPTGTTGQPKTTPVADMFSTLGGMGGNSQSAKTWDLLSNLAKAQGV